MATRWIKSAGVAAIALVALGCKPGADYQFTTERTSGGGDTLIADSCPDVHSPPGVTPNPGLAGIFGASERATESVDGTNEAVVRFSATSELRVLAGGTATTSEEYSIALLFRLSDLDGSTPLIDFKEDGPAGLGVYLQDGKLAFPQASVEGTTVIAEDEWVQVIVTRDPTGVVRGYLDGVQEWSFTDGTGLATNPQSFLYLFNRPGEAASAGAVARLRLYPWAIKPDVAASLDQTPATPC